MKIAVFIDFDNIEIGVKTTLNQQFDIAAILEAVKERGEVITKVAYGDWKRAGDYGRLLSQHAIRMVQRNLTPGGDKNGADINLALDALEMAFTHHHINAFVIVGGDSDFITLVEKLKQYDKKVFVVGGRQFTSLVMQKNCHEFIAYENLVGGRRQVVATPGRRTETAPAGPLDVAKAIPLVKRALKVLVDREVSPQLGLLKSTLLQLDSTFSERDYGASTFRDFIEKVAKTGLVTLRQSGRSMLVDLAEGTRSDVPGNGNAVSQPEPAEAGPTAPPPSPPPLPSSASLPSSPSLSSGPPAEPAVAAAPRDGAPAVVDPAQVQQAIQHVRELFERAAQPPRWPMYMRQVKQYLRTVDEGFDERKWGFGTIVEFLRACQRDGLLRLERDRKGILRVFSGTALQRQAGSVDGGLTPQADETGEQPPAESAGQEWQGETAAEGVSEPQNAAEDPMMSLQQESSEQETAPAEEAPKARPARARRPRKTAAAPGQPAAATRRASSTKAATPRKRREQV